MINKEKITIQGWNLEKTYTSLPQIFYSKIETSPISEPELVILNESLAKDLGLDPEELRRKEGLGILSGNNFPEASFPIAQAYSGHQFGHFTTLGDGRALLIGEQRTPDKSLFDIQLKGSGITPYSRGGDGRATVASMLREYIISEAMYFLGVPTSRSLSVVRTKDHVYRQRPEDGGILCRIAKSHIRVGTFEFASKYGSVEDLKALADYTISRQELECMDKENPYLEFLKQVIKKQANLVSKWMLVGFIHGVMNTDNMSIAGETIDYGPCAFMDIYNPETVFSSIDRQGRYAYGQQARIAGWNLSVFAESLLPLLSDNKEKSIEMAKEALGEFDELYFNNWFSGIKKKLGFVGDDPEDRMIVTDLLELLESHEVDFTHFFTALTLDNLEVAAVFETKEFIKWNQKRETRLLQQEGGKEMARQLMETSNPWIIPRNRDVERVLKIAVEDKNYMPLQELLTKISMTYDYSKLGQENLLVPKPSESSYKTYCGT